VRKVVWFLEIEGLIGVFASREREKERKEEIKIWEMGEERRKEEVVGLVPHLCSAVSGLHERSE